MKQGCSEAVVASCMLGSIHRKQFRLLLSDIDPVAMTLKCCGGHPHVRIEGKYTKASAVYTEGVAMHIAKGFSKSLKIIACEELAEEAFADGSGKESLLVNDLLRGGGWKIIRSWFWKVKSHINLLEMNTVVSLQKQKLLSGLSDRHCILLDSLVSKGAFSKGRSSSHALQAVLKRSAAIQLIGGQYPGFSFAPTKLNVADDPTRNVRLRESSLWTLREFLDVEFLRSAACTGLSRSQANWVRLVILATCVLGSEGCSISFPSHRSSLSFWNFDSPWILFFIGFLLVSASDFRFLDLCGILSQLLGLIHVCLTLGSLCFSFLLLSIWTFDLFGSWTFSFLGRPLLTFLPGCKLQLGVVFALCVCLSRRGGCHGTADNC